MHVGWVWYNTEEPEEVKGAQAFRRLVAANPDLKFYRPNADKAPWHWQCRIESADGVPIFLNFWPHRMKAYRDGGDSVVGEDEIAAMVCKAKADAVRMFDLRLIED